MPSKISISYFKTMPLIARVLYCSILIFAQSVFARAESEKTDYIVIPKSTYGITEKNKYQYDLLTAAMKATAKDYGDYRVAFSKVAYTDARIFDSLHANKNVSLFNAPLDPDRAKGLHIVPIPVDRGILGYRVLLVHRDNKDAFQQVSAQTDLERFTAGMFEQSSTIKQLKRLGLPVVATHGEDTMFNMLNHKRFDYVLRGVHEVEDDLARYSSLELDLVIEPTVAVHLYMPLVFYMSKSQVRLAKRIELGLLRINRSGEFKSIFDRYFKHYLVNNDLGKRKIIPLDSDLEGKFSLKRDEGLWFTPDEIEDPHKFPTDKANTAY